LSIRECSIAVYEGKKKRRISKGFSPASLMYCYSCRRYYLTEPIIAGIKEKTGYGVLIRDDHTLIPGVQTLAEVTTASKPPSTKENERAQATHTSKASSFKNENPLSNKPEIIATIRIKHSDESDSRLLKVTTGEPNPVINTISWRSNIYRAAMTAIKEGRNRFTLLDSGKYEYEIIEYEVIKNITPEEITTSSIRIVDFTPENGPKPIYLYYGNVSCIRKAHVMESVTANVPSLYSEKLYKLNVTYCKNCDMYFIYHGSYWDYVEKYGSFILKPIHLPSRGDVFDTEFFEGDRYFNLKESSDLSDYGYSAKAGIPEVERQKVLVSIIEFGLMKKHEIINHLHTINDMNMNNSQHSAANRRRRDDIRFLNDYELNRQRQIFGYILMRASKMKR